MRIQESNTKLQVLLELELELENTKAEIERLHEVAAHGDQLVEQSNSDKDQWKIKEQELLDFTMKLTTKNAELGSECQNLKAKLLSTEVDCEKKKKLLQELEIEKTNLLQKLDSLSNELTLKQDNFNKSLEERDRSICNLTIKIEENSDEIRTIKRKNTATLKDLTRQLQQYKKDLKNDNSDHSQNGDATIENGLGSRVGSCGSLDDQHSSPDGTASISSNNR